MRVLMFHPTMDIGGAPINSIALATKLQAYGHRVVFLADDGPLVERLQERGIGYRRLVYRGRSHRSLALLADIVRAIRAEHAEVVWTAGILPCLKAHLACWLTNTPLFPLHGSDQVVRFYLPRVGKCGWVNPHHRDHMLQVFGWTSEDVLLIRGRMEMDAYRPRPQEDGILRRYGVGEDERVVALIGNVTQEKWGSLELFLDVAQALAEKRRDLRFVIVGEGLAGFRADYERCRHMAEAINQRCGWPAVVLTGALRQVPAVMHRADIVAGMASTSILSLLCARPTIVLGNRGCSAIVTPETFEGLVYHHFNMHERSQQKQPDELCHQIETLLEDEHWRVQLGQWGRKAAAEIYDVNVGALQFERALQDTIAGHGKDLGARVRWLREILRSLASAGMYRLKRKRLLTAERSS